MKGKHGRRLALLRETLKQLDPQALAGAKGAATVTCPSRPPACCTASYSCPPPPSAECSTD